MPSHSEESNRPAGTAKPEQNIAHGSAGNQETSSHVDRADKTAPLPQHEKGAGLQGADASAGSSKGKDQGRPGIL